MKRVLLALAFTALLLSGCAGTAPHAPAPEACRVALEAADEIITGSARTINALTHTLKTNDYDYAIEVLEDEIGKLEKNVYNEAKSACLSKQ